MHSQCTFEIDLAKIRANYRIISELCKTAKVGAVMKSNCYGLGASSIAPVLQTENCRNFFVVSAEEGIALRKILGQAGSNIFVLHGVFSNDVREFKESNLIPILNNLEQVKIWQKFAILEEKILPCAIHVDTGMNRLGMNNAEVQHIVDNPSSLVNLELQYIISHLSASEMANNPYNFQQLTKFKNYLKHFPTIKASFCNSSGVFLGEQYHFDLIRLGAALYGINPLGSEFKNPMYNTVRLTAPIIQLQKLSPKNYIGYNMTFKTNRHSLIATLPIGYGDGYFRAFSNCGVVDIDGHLAPVVGRVSMDLITIDVTDLPREKIFLGQKVEIIGNNCTVEKIGNIINTIGYEILTTVLSSNRYRKVYKNDS